MEDAKKAMDQAEQKGYDVGLVKTKKALRAEISGVCRTYCLQVWNEAINLAGMVGIKASLTFRRVENVYYPPTIQAPDFSTSQDDAEPKDLSSIQEIPA